MGTGLLEILGIDETDPEVQAALEDAECFANLIETLVEVRQRLQLTQTDVARTMETSQSVISNFERIGGDPRFSTVQRYARAVGAKLAVRVHVDGEEGWRRVSNIRGHVSAVTEPGDDMAGDSPTVLRPRLMRVTA